MARLAASRQRDADSGAETLVERATSLIHRDILTGAFAPNAKLGIHELSKRYDLGPTPIREALSRLCPRGFVEATANRGFRVHPISREDLEDIVATRLVIELEAFRRSIARGDDEWEASVLSALHRLVKILDRESTGMQEGVEEYDRVHKRFHTSLISACGVPRLIELHEMLYDQTYRYRSVTFQAHTKLHPGRTREVHTELAKLAIGRDVESACAQLTRHILSTLLNVYPESRKDYPQYRRRK